MAKLCTQFKPFNKYKVFNLNKFRDYNASYRWGIHRIEDDQTSYTANHNTSDDRAQIFRQTSSGTNEANVGFHGEVNFYNVGNVTIDGNSTSARWTSTEDYAPTIMGDLVGFDTASGAYVRENSIGRYNVSNPHGYYTGFCIMGETGELAGSHMALYGLNIMSKAAELANLIGNINALVVDKQELDNRNY